MHQPVRAVAVSVAMAVAAASLTTAAPQPQALTAPAVTRPADAVDDSELDFALQSIPHYRSLVGAFEKVEAEIAASRLGDAHPRMQRLLRHRETLRQKMLDFREQVRARRVQRAKFMGEGLGLVVDRVPGATAAPLNLPRGAGLVVERVLVNTPALAGGLMPGDVLVRLDGQLLVNNEQFEVVVESLPAGLEVQVELFRDGEPLKRAITLPGGAKP